MASPVKIVALLMIKNESRIIQRCLTHLADVVDAYSILDTGSNDDTIDVIHNAFKTVDVLKDKPYNIAVENFVNFGESRTRSFQVCHSYVKDKLEWDLEVCYGLAVDADMNIVKGEKWADVRSGVKVLNKNGYQMIQKNHTIEYYNMRMMRLGNPWKCVGATHEYWDGENYERIGREYIYIDDKNDGGCKSDKFERDERLLLAEMVEQPTNPRTHFYLAQTYDCLGKKKDAIRIYKKRIEIGGWYEEIWYSHYKIAQIYKELDKPEKMELWTERALNFYGKRSEALYMCMRYFLDKRNYEKALYYCRKGLSIPYPNDDSLFIEDGIYKGEFDYYYTIMYYYLFIDNKANGIREHVSYVNRWPTKVRNTYENMMFFVEPVRGLKAVFHFPKKENHHVCNSSIIEDASGYLMNIRYVDYYIKDGGYIWPNGTVTTKNYLYHLDDKFEPDSAMEEVSYETAPGFTYKEAQINGYEDVRLYRDMDGQLNFYGSCSNLNADARIQIAHGKVGKGSLCTDVCELPSPQGRYCEKNWVFWPERGGYVYEWSPYTLCNKEGAVILKKETNQFMREWRGSTIVKSYRGSSYCLVHQVIMRDGKRNYIHALVELDVVSGLPVRHTTSFCFDGHGTEYCIGMILKDEWAYFVYTVMDDNLALKKVFFDNFEWIAI